MLEDATHSIVHVFLSCFCQPMLEMFDCACIFPSANACASLATAQRGGGWSYRAKPRPTEPPEPPHAASRDGSCRLSSATTVLPVCLWSSLRQPGPAVVLQLLPEVRPHWGEWGGVESDQHGTEKEEVLVGG